MSKTKNIKIDDRSTIILLSYEHEKDTNKYIFAYDLSCEKLMFHKTGVKNIFDIDERNAINMGLTYIIESILSDISKYIWALNTYIENCDSSLNNKISILLNSELLLNFQNIYKNTSEEWINENSSREYLDYNFIVYETDAKITLEDVLYNVCAFENANQLIENNMFICQNTEFLKIYQSMNDKNLVIFYSCLDVAKGCYHNAFCKNCDLDCMCKYYINNNYLTDDQLNEIEEVNSANITTSVVFKQNSGNLMN